MAIKFPKHILAQDYQEIIFWIKKFKELEFLNEDFTLISQDANGKDIDDVLAVSFEQDSKSNIIIICGADGSDPYISKDAIKSFSSSANYEKTLFIKYKVYLKVLSTSKESGIELSPDVFFIISPQKLQNVSLDLLDTAKNMYALKPKLVVFQGNYQDNIFDRCPQEDRKPATNETGNNKLLARFNQEGKLFAVDTMACWKFIPTIEELFSLGKKVYDAILWNTALQGLVRCPANLPHAKKLVLPGQRNDKSIRDIYKGLKTRDFDMERARNKLREEEKHISQTDFSILMGNKNVTEEDLNNIADSYTNYVFADAYREENDEYQSFLQNHRKLVLSYAKSKEISNACNLYAIADDYTNRVFANDSGEKNPNYNYFLINNRELVFALNEICPNIYAGRDRVFEGLNIKDPSHKDMIRPFYTALVQTLEAASNRDSEAVGVAPFYDLFTLMIGKKVLEHLKKGNLLNSLSINYAREHALITAKRKAMMAAALESIQKISQPSSNDYMGHIISKEQELVSMPGVVSDLGSNTFAVPLKDMKVDYFNTSSSLGGCKALSSEDKKLCLAEDLLKASNCVASMSFFATPEPSTEHVPEDINKNGIKKKLH